MTPLVLDELREYLGAACVGVLQSGVRTEIVIASPVALVGMGWPPVIAPEGMVTDASALSTLLPTAVRLRMGRPKAAAVRRMAGGALALLVAWGQPPDPSVLEALDERLRTGLDAALTAAAGREVADRERLAMESVLSALDSAVITIHPERGEARFNTAAGRLLDLPDDASAQQVAQAMLGLQQRALNPQDVADLARGVHAGDAAHGVWHFATEPTHLKVATHRIAADAGGGRVWVLTDVSGEYDLLDNERQARLRLRVATDSMLDPQVLLTPVRNADSEVVDFVYADVNRACSDYLGMTQAQLLGASVDDSLPQLRESGLFSAYVEVLETGRPLILDDFAFYNDVLADQRRYDIRAAKADDGLSLTWRDVTQRFEDAKLLQQSQERLAATVDSMLTPHLMLSSQRDEHGLLVDLRITSANAAAAEYLNIPADELVGEQVRRRLRPEQFEPLRAWCLEVLDGSGRFAQDDVPFPGNEWELFLDVKMVRIGSEVSFTFQDVTARHRMLEQVAESEEHYRLLAQNSSDVVVLIRDGLVTWSSPALTTALRWLPTQWRGQRFVELVDPDDRQDVSEHLRRVSAGATEVRTVGMSDAEGQRHWVELHSSPYVDAAGRSSGVVTSFRVVDAEVAEDAELQRQARLDALTGLVNRREAMRFLRAAMDDSRVDRARVGVLFCDLDRFKLVNDQYGHAAGDEVLKTVASELKRNVRSVDAVGRMGGDELVVILPGVLELDDLLALAKTIHDRVSRPLLYGGAEIPVTVSVGAALARPGELPEQLVARADAAMYEAKRTGRNRVMMIP